MFESHPPQVRGCPGCKVGLRGRGGGALLPRLGHRAKRPRHGAVRAAAWILAVLGASLLAGCDEGPRLAVVSHGVERWATVDRPMPPAGSPRPLLVVLHAALFSGPLTRDELNLPAIARRAGVALAFPEANGTVWNDGSLSQALPDVLSPAADDIAYIDAVIAALVADGTAAPDALNLAGVSSGGMMALRYACARADHLASVAVFLATMPPDAERDCRPARPLNIVMVAGTADPLVRWTGEVVLGGFATLQQRMSVPASFDFWRRANRCTGLAPSQPLPRRGSGTQPDVLVHAATGCAGGVTTVLYEVRGGGHRLLAGDDWTLLRLLGRASPDLDPGRLLLAFALEPRQIPGVTQGDPRQAGSRQ